MISKILWYLWDYRFENSCQYLSSNNFLKCYIFSKLSHINKNFIFLIKVHFHEKKFWSYIYLKVKKSACPNFHFSKNAFYKKEKEKKMNKIKDKPQLGPIVTLNHKCTQFLKGEIGPNVSLFDFLLGLSVCVSVSFFWLF